MDLMLVIFFISLFTVAAAIVVKPIQNLFLTQPLLAMLAGILLGPYLLDVIHSVSSEERNRILELVCKITIAMALMSTALRIPIDFSKKHLKTLSVIVFLGMLLMWLFSAGILYWVGGPYYLSLAECLLIGAIITPTDPVISSTILSGRKAQKYLPESVRHTISFESGVNDGLAYPIVLFSVFLFKAGSFPFSKWLSESILYETVLASIIAVTVGHLAGLLMHKANAKGYMTNKAMLTFSIGLALLLLSGLESLHMNGIIGVFVGGLAFSMHLEKNEDLKEERVQESLERIVTIPVFFLFGLFLPWQEWYQLGWSAVGTAALILLLRRIPGFLILKPFLSNYKGKLYDVLIMGWFGPIGVAALFYAIFSIEKTGLNEIWVITSLIVFSSTVIHGLTGIPFEKLYNKLKSN